MQCPRLSPPVALTFIHHMKAKEQVLICFYITQSLAFLKECGNHFTGMNMGIFERLDKTKLS